ncbi:SGNH/GDSL hydrolase family protein [Bradyrhizobium sp. BRP22]|uniref:SGNH/GDSL hydrolase family protein n=1 Tax=Bradyrhizobium sp. BRP22 TaxID=2793821 RepID=UPI001CD73126|nr:SGNH/GDSL hydrolase family protein [Bradyrhizobium sp. BRP22]MCA1452241.1 SGNH/GDSL hydrolase family protein [Bradyrhizobium sp. BRP22]
MPSAQQPCNKHLELFKFKPLTHFANALRHQRKVKVVAIGSSSTAGTEGVLPYPPRLEMLLRQGDRHGIQGFYGRMIDILNRGIGGQEAPEELSRFESDVLGEAPALVIWQVGTNAVYRDHYNPDEVRAAIEVGLDMLSTLPADVVIMDSQYVRAVVEEPSKLKRSKEMTALISSVANAKGVNLFSRFALMQRWVVEDNVPLPELDDGGGLHTSEWATGCVTHALFDVIKQATEAPPST